MNRDEAIALIARDDLARLSVDARAEQLENGDTLEVRREVDHWAYFPTSKGRNAFVAELAAAGFTLVHASTGEDSPELPFGAHVKRVESVELDAIHEVVMYLVETASTYGGEYDGWETSVERSPKH